MRSNVKNIVATVLVALIVIPYLGYLVWGEMPFIEDPRGMAATGLILGVAAAIVVGRAVLDPAPMSRAALGTGVVAAVLGIATLWAETNETLLAVFITAIVVSWGLGETAYLASRRTAGRHLAATG